MHRLLLLCNTSKDQDQQEETTGGSVAGSWAHQSDLLRRLPSSGNRSRKFSDSITRILSSHICFFTIVSRTSDNSPRSSGSATHQEVLDHVPSWFLDWCPATCEAAAAFSNFSFSSFFSFFIFSSLIPSLCSIRCWPLHRRSVSLHSRILLVGFWGFLGVVHCSQIFLLLSLCNRFLILYPSSSVFCHFNQ